VTITFDGQARTITLGMPGMVSVRAIWTQYIDWMSTGDNSKHHQMLFTVGMDTSDIPFYLFMADGVTMVVVDNTSPTIIYDGTLKTYDDRDPFGGAVANVRYQDPGIAIGYSTTGAAGPSAESIASAVLAAMQGTTFQANVKAVNDTPITGLGLEPPNHWRPL